MTISAEARNFPEKNAASAYFKDMLVKQTFPFRMEYLQPLTNVGEPKASPLALLAATCSSIGKTDIERLNTDITKSRDRKHTEDAKCKLDISPPVPVVRKTKDKFEVFKPYEKNIKVERHTSSEDDYSASRKVVSSANTHVDRMPPLHCVSSPQPYSTQHSHPECYQCKSNRIHIHPPTTHHPPASTHFPSVKPASRPCFCPMCVPPNHPYKYKPMTSCRDPGCTNCPKMPSQSSIHNFPPSAVLNPCTHPHTPFMAHAPVPLANNFNAYPKLHSNPNPYICNWVSEGRHCGCGFSSSEELFQHLKTHTTLQQQQKHSCESYIKPVARAQPMNICAIEGCMCKKSIKKVSQSEPLCDFRSTSAPHRYSPYGHPPHISGRSSLPYSSFPYS